MLTLKDSAELRAQPCEVYDWFLNLVDNYTDWHPDHVRCRYVRGEPLQVGSVLNVEEYLHGRLHKLRFKLTSVEPDHGFMYRIAPGLHGGFSITPTKSGTSRVEATLCIGWNQPIIGPVVDFVITRLFQTQLNDLQIHMYEEGQNLSRLLGAEEKMLTH